MFSVNVAINYLAKRKFGALIDIANLLANFDTQVNAGGNNQLDEIEAFKSKLRKLSPTDLEKLYLKVKEQDATSEALAERERIYNQKDATADFVHWSKAAQWSLDESIALSFGKDPDLVSWKKIEPYKEKSAYVKQYAKRRDLVLRANKAKRLNDPVIPIDFISWAKELDITLPIELLSELEKLGNTAINWRKEWLNLKDAYDLVAYQKLVTNTATLKTENLLKAVVSIAIDAYGYDPNSAKSTAPKDIADALKKHGISLDPKTIRSWLKEGMLLLPRKPT